MKKPMALEFTVNLKTLSFRGEMRRLAPTEPRHDWRATSTLGRCEREIPWEKSSEAERSCGSILASS
jgi:hypothetical protein